MVSKVFAIKDEKAEAFMAPFTMPAVGMALRAFSDLVNDGSSAVSKHPGDYKLYQVGIFDDFSGILGGVDFASGPVLLASGSEYTVKDKEAIRRVS